MFKDAISLKSIQNLGFTKTSLGNQEMVEALYDIYNRHYRNLLGDMTVTHNHENGPSPLEIHQEIQGVVAPYFNEIFSGFKFLASHFVIKKGKSSSYFQLHQDWNVVDERRYYNYQVWIPLDISYPENGGICFLPESHLGFNNYRSGSNGLPLIDLDEKIHSYLSYLRLLPGEAGVFYSKTFHGSFINATENNRIAVLVNIIQEKAQPLYYHRNEQNLIDAYPISTEEIFKYLPELEKGRLPFSKDSVDTIEAPRINIDLQDLLTFAETRDRTANRSKHYEHKLFHILRNRSLEIELNKKGFVVIDLLKEAEIEVLQSKMDELFPNRDQYSGTFSSVSAFDKNKRKRIHEFIFANIKDSLDEYFSDYDVPLSLFYSRKPDKTYLLDWHQDPSLIFNEHLEPLYGLWCPLVDIDNHHGALKVIPGSHRWINKLHLAYKLIDWPFDGVRKYLNQFAVNFKLKAGQAILFDARIIHGSEPNYSNIYRDNIVMRVNHKNSKFFNIVTNPKQHELGRYFEQEKDFFYTDTLRNHVGEPESGNFVGELYIIEDIIDQDFIDRKRILFE